MPTLHKFSLHLSSWLIISGAAVALLLIVIPGEFPVLPKLVEICIDENRVTPRVLEWLSQQPELKRVKLWSEFPIDDSRWREVQSALRGISIEDRLGEVHH